MLPRRMSHDHSRDAHPLTPDWVGDAVFYQIFPDRFARSGRVGGLNLQPWGEAPEFQDRKSVV